MEQEWGRESYTRLKEAHDELMEDNRWVKDENLQLAMENPILRRENECLVEGKRQLKEDFRRQRGKFQKQADAELAHIWAQQTRQIYEEQTDYDKLYKEFKELRFVGEHVRWKLDEEQAELVEREEALQKLKLQLEAEIVRLRTKEDEEREAIN